MNKLNKINRAVSKIDTANEMIVIAHMIPEVKHAIGLIAEASILLGEVAEELEMEDEDE
jgi:hypothetical protein